MAGLLDTFFGSDDPSTADPTTGLVDSQRRQLAFNALGNIGATLLAAGQNIMPQDRARILAGLGDAPNQLAQQQLMMQRAGQARRQEMADAELSKLGNSPDFMQAVSQMPPELQAAIPALMRAGRAREAISMVGDWRQAQAREKALQTRQEAPPAGYQWVAPGRLAPIDGGPEDPAIKKQLADARRELKAIPAAENDKLAVGGTSLRNIDKTIDAIDAAGPGNKPSWTPADWIAKVPMAGDKAANIINPSGAMFRAAIADVSSALLQARSGLAVTAAEYQRLAAKLPDATEDPKIIKDKLAAIRSEMADILRGQSAQYTKENGYIPHANNSVWAGGPQAATPQQNASAPSRADIEAEMRRRGLIK